MTSFGDICKLGLLIVLSPLLILVYFCFAIYVLLFPVGFTKWFIFNVPGASWQQGDLTPEDVQADHRSAPTLCQLPKSGELVEYDFRKGKDINQLGEGMDIPMDQSTDDPQLGQEIRIISYNIFLAQNLTGVIEELSMMDPPPDIVFLQEDNIYQLPQEGNENNERKNNSSFHHAGGAIAKALNMSCIFANAHYRGGKESPNGLYGMSIISRFKLRNIKALRCETQPWIVDQMMTWLMGERHFPYAEIGQGKDAIALSSVHLPSVGKFSEKIQMMRVLFRQVEEAPAEMAKETIPSIIGGDMNTASFIYRWILPFGSNDLYFSCKSETSLFRKFIDENNYFDPFSNDDGTFQYPGGKNCKLDWVLLQKNRFEVSSIQVQPSTNIHDNSSDQKKKIASDHQWVSVTCLLA